MRRERPTLAQLGDAWFESEQPYSTGCAAELRRIRRRAASRPVLVIVLAALATAGITYRVATTAPLVEAEVILALSEEALAGDHKQLPAIELREYVTSVLLSDHRLLAVIERWNLHPLRARLGAEYALTELRSQLEVAIWKNTFLYYHLDEHQARKSARIGLTVADTDPDRATAIAQDLARTVIDAHADERRAVTAALARQVAAMRTRTERELDSLAFEISLKQAALMRAKQAGKHGLASALFVDVTALAEREKLAEEQLAQIVQSRDAFADAIASAGLDISMRIVEERRPPQAERGALSLFLVIVVVGTCSVFGASLVVGAFDPRIHDLEDVKRLGLPVLGRVP